MVNLNWKGKNDLKELINSKNHENHSMQEIELINSPINKNIYNFSEINRKMIKNEIRDVNFEEKWNNMLFLGDNKLLMDALTDDFNEKITLIYFDPPFATGGDFNFKIFIGERDNSDNSQRWLNKIAYSDTWRNGINSYLNFMYERLFLMRELLAENGSIYIHLDWHVGHYIKIMMDEIFGVDNFRNELIWSYPAASVQTKRFFVRSFDTILFYTKSNDYIFNDDPNNYMEYSDRVKKALKVDEKGFYYHRGGSHNGKKLSQKVYTEKKGVFPRDVWNDIPYVRANTIEYQGFSTQKPERLLKRIILASTNENDIIADFFCGSGTTLVVAEKLGRRWIGCDSTNYAIHMTRKRLLDIYNGKDLFNWNKKYKKIAKSFKILTIGKLNKEKLIPIEFVENGSLDKEFLKISEKANFKVKLRTKEKGVSIELSDYIVPYLDLISKDVKKHIKKWTDWIDYWSIDFNNKGEIFNTMWVSYRTPKKRTLKLVSDPFYYKEGGIYQVLVKVIDIFRIENIQSYKITIS
ncbi:MAG: site-specific DNA-methyltransferase [Promethearchaeota archaeon]